MESLDLQELERLLVQVAHAPSKKLAQPAVARLKFLAANLKGEISGYTAGKLEQAIICAEAAAGPVKDKDHQIRRMGNAWRIFKSDIEHGNANT